MCDSGWCRVHDVHCDTTTNTILYNTYYTYTNMHAYSQKCKYTCEHTLTSTVHAHIHAHMHTCMQMRAHTNAHAHLHWCNHSWLFRSTFIFLTTKLSSWATALITATVTNKGLCNSSTLLTFFRFLNDSKSYSTINPVLHVDKQTLILFIAHFHWRSQYCIEEKFKGRKHLQVLFLTTQVLLWTKICTMEIYS